MNKRVCLALFLIAVLSPALHAGWSQMQRLTYRGNEINPQVVARHDTVHVMWSQALSAGKISYVRSTDSGTTWGNIIDLTEPGHVGHYPIMALTDSAIWICWLDNNLESIAIVSSAAGGNWSTPIYKYTIDSQRWGGLCMAVSGDTIFLTYLAETPDSTGLMPFKFFRSLDGGQSWSNLITIGHNIIGTLSMELFYGNGYLLLAVSTAPGDGGFHILGYVSNNAGQTWSDTVWISPNIIPTAQQPCIAYNSITGQFAVGFMDYRYQQYAFYGDIFIRLTNTDPYQWGYEAQVTEEHTAKYPSVYYLGNSLIAVWADRKYYSTGDDEIFFNLSTDGGVSWNGPQRLTNTYSQSIYPRLYKNNNTIHVVWFEHDTSGGNGCDIYYKRYNPDTSDIIIDEPIKPSAFTLSAYPNPFNSTLSININTETAGVIYISDILGRFVTELDYPKGTSIMKWNATDNSGGALPSGPYFIKPKGGSCKDIIKVMYLK